MNKTSNIQSGIINKTLFNKASREYEYYVHGVDRDIRQQTKTICPACSDDAMAASIDGNFRLERLKAASQRFDIVHKNIFNIFKWLVFTFSVNVSLDKICQRNRLPAILVLFCNSSSVGISLD